MDIASYLKDELRRLNRINDLLEKQMNKADVITNEPEQIVNNVRAMCEIAKSMYTITH